MIGSIVSFYEWQLSPSLQVVNGKTAVVLRYPDGSVYSVLSIETYDGKIISLHLIGSPAKLGHL